MRGLLTSLSYIFHPLFIPFIGSVSFFLVSPLQEVEFQIASLYPIFILTVIVPIIFFLLLRSLKLIDTIFANTRKERVYPLILAILINLAILYQVIPKYKVPELYFYFLGLTLSLLSILLMIVAKIKASIHMMGMGSMLLFLIGISIHFEMNITLTLSLVTFFTGLVATSRLYLHAHTKPELLIGFLIGGLSQLLLFQFWL